MNNRYRHLKSLLIAAAVCMTVSPAFAQIPDTFTNLQVLPEDISKDSLVQIMRSFSFALGVRCQHCHVGGDGVSFEGVEFDKDDDPDKRNARFMMRMVANLNQHVLPLTPERESPQVNISCKTCHRGLARPIPLLEDMLFTIDAAGVDSAVTRYKHLRAEFATSGAYDFGEWETNGVAEKLIDEGQLEDAVKIYQLNEEFYPKSVSITSSIARLYEQLGDTEKAIQYYERTLEIRPGLSRIQERIEALKNGG